MSRRHLVNEIVGFAKQKEYTVSEYKHDLIQCEAYREK